ncbi:MAG: hypothetical protein Q8R02_05150, partial [Hyphomonadaceae bacterium]|nr:hypothetical protein [Hyphomonadaceae bacterium]
MSTPTANPRLVRRLALLWAAIAIALMGVIVWGAMQTDDPLSSYVHTDKARHILAFGAIGLCAAFMPSTRLKLMALGGVLCFALVSWFCGIVRWRTRSRPALGFEARPRAWDSSASCLPALNSCLGSR